MPLSRTLLLILCAGLLATDGLAQQRGGRGARGSRQGRSGRMETREKAAEAARLKQREQVQRKQAQQALQKRVSAMKQHAAKARKEAQAYQNQQRKGSGGGLLQTFQQRCAACHTYPDPQSETDQVWLRRVSATSCKGTPAEAREKLAEYLTSLQGLHPRTITSAADPLPTQVAVTTSLETGELFLKNRAGAVYRLRWDPGTEGEWRVVPAGTYTVLGYRLVEGPWLLSATGGSRPYLLAPGAPRHIPINTSLKAIVSVTPRGENAFVQLQLSGTDGMGVGIYGGGYAIPISYVVAQGKEVVGQGSLRNMGAGTYTALLRPPEGPQAMVKVELPPALPVTVMGTGIARLPQVKPKTPRAAPGGVGAPAPPKRPTPPARGRPPGGRSPRGG